MNEVTTLYELPSMKLTDAQIDNAKLPALYVQSCDALAKCDQLDECKQWHSKMEALAAYAHQARNDDLERCAKRIRNRAFRRVGEILAEVPSLRGKYRSEDKSLGEGFISGMAKVGKQHGITPNRVTDHVKVASIPEAKFNQLNDQPKTPSIRGIIKSIKDEAATAAREAASAQRFAEAKLPPGYTIVRPITRAHSMMKDLDLSEMDYLLKTLIGKHVLHTLCGHVDEMIETLVQLREGLDVVMVKEESVTTSRRRA